MWTLLVWLTLICATEAVAVPPQAGSAVNELVGKAKALELRGRTELARETWEQVLQEDPGNAEALQGMIRSLRAGGHPADAEAYAAKLRAVHPQEASPKPGAQAPVLAAEAAAAPHRGGDRESQLREAERLYREGRLAEAAEAYRALYGANPPPGEVALHVYAAEGASEDGRPQAIASLRALMDRFPGEVRYRKALGALLVQNARTAPEGEKLLGGKGTAAAQMAGFSRPLGMPRPVSTPPASVPAEPRESVTGAVSHAEAPRAALAATTEKPAPLVLARPVKPIPPTPDAMAPGPTAAEKRPPVTAAAEVARSGEASVALPAVVAGPGAASKANESETRAGYAALNGGRLREAELKFKVVLARDPADGRALGGLGLVRLRQSAWNEAADLLQQAQQRGASEPAFARGLEQVRAAGGTTVQIAKSNGTPGKIDSPSRPTSPPASAPAVAEADSGVTGAAKALSLGGATVVPSTVVPSTVNTSTVVPSTVNTSVVAPGTVAPSSVETDPRVAAVAVPAAPASSSATVASRAAEKSVIAPTSPAGKEKESTAETQQPASPLPESGRSGASLVAQLHQRGEEADALKELDRMPRDSLRDALQSPAFAVTVAAIEESQGREEAARQVLESSLAHAPDAAAVTATPAVSGSQGIPASQGISANPATRDYGPAQLALANLLLKGGENALAYARFRAAIASQFRNAQAWAGLLASLQASGHDAETLTQMDAVPAAVRAQLESNGLFLQTAALAYAGTGDKARAILYWSHLQQYAEANRVLLPAAISIKFAQWLGRAGDERNLYPVLMSLGSRTDLSDNQRRSVQKIWAAWAVRQAVAAARGGEAERARLILGSAAGAFADDAAALRTLGSGYMAVNQPKSAIALFHGQDLSQASARDLSAAIGAALATRDTRDAEIWLRAGLPRFRSDPDLLMLASRYEKETGHERESAAYLQAALSQTPPQAAKGVTGGAVNGVSAPRLEVASAEMPRGAVDGSTEVLSSDSPNLTVLFAKARTPNKARGGDLAQGTRPFLPSFGEGAAAIPPGGAPR